MVWVKKAAAPDYVSALARLRLGMVGTGIDDWLLPWLNLVQLGQTLDVNAFCEAGPPPPADFNNSDFLAATGGVFGAALGIIGLQDKITARAREILFADLCENTLTTGTTCDVMFADITQEAPGGTPFSATAQATPAGTAHIKVTYLSAGNGGVPDMHCYFYLNGAYVGEAFDSRGNYGAVGQERQFAPLAGSNGFKLNTNNQNGHYKVEACHPGSVEEYEPDPIAQPDAAVPPPANVYTTIADLGAELDQIEQKLHWVLDFTSGAILEVKAPLVADEISSVESDEEVALGPDVAGFIVTVGTIPPGVSMKFGAPPQYKGLGRVVVGNGTAWGDPIDITVTPMLILKTSTFQTACRVQLVPPATATVTTLVKAYLGSTV